MKKLLIQTTVTAALVIATTPAALAAPPDDGCARGYELWDVAAEPYTVDNAIDEQGNADGAVCARQLGQGVSIAVGVDFPVYQFTDNTLLQ